MDDAQKKPARPLTVHDGISYFDSHHYQAMRRGCEELRDRIMRLLTDRIVERPHDGEGFQ